MDVQKRVLIRQKAYVVRARRILESRHPDWRQMEVTTKLVEIVLRFGSRWRIRAESHERKRDSENSSQTV